MSLSEYPALLTNISSSASGPHGEISGPLIFQIPPALPPPPPPHLNHNLSPFGTSFHPHGLSFEPVQRRICEVSMVDVWEAPSPLAAKTLACRWQYFLSATAENEVISTAKHEQYSSEILQGPSRVTLVQQPTNRCRPISAADGRGYVYILDEGATPSGNRIIKVGMAKNFVRRYSQHQRMCPKRNQEVVRKKKVRFRRREEKLCEDRPRAVCALYDAINGPAVIRGFRGVDCISRESGKLEVRVTGGSDSLSPVCEPKGWLVLSISWMLSDCNCGDRRRILSHTGITAQRIKKAD
ncbi:hypothetical protein BDP27DRAFT_1361219 [Rhodocollybia butyracea]|uniref:Bacteriophage T5 Orf172 DNA-binding domain-containing protein n=1 Tax=Rhodocollybia butyracea TaxID=206335 RepID=A0A9P5Q1C0_9AGAR|nr:hypothetical protein BDP27DRAFT_1361219 [Rhodocollybia butyracea]